MIQAIRRGWYVFRWMLHAAYSFVHFFAKPGARIIVPVGFAIVAFMVGISAQRPGNNVLPLAVFLLIATALFAWGYPKLSHGLAVVMGAFPPIRRPLPPRRMVKAARKKKELKPAVVRQIVPPLRRRRSVPPIVAIPVLPEASRPIPVTPPVQIARASVPLVFTVPLAVVRIAVPPQRLGLSYGTRAALPIAAGQ